MKKTLTLLSIILLLLSSSFVHAGQFDAVITQYNAASAGGDTYTDITFWWRCESTTFTGDDYSSGDSTPTVNSAVAINSDAGMVGTNGIDCPTGGDSYSFDSASIIDGSTGTIGFYWKFYDVTWTSFVNIFRGETDSGDYFRLMTYDDDRLRFTWNGTNFTTTATYSIDTEYFIQIVFDVTTDTVKLIVDNSEDIDTTATPISGLTLDTIYWGTETGGADIYLDNIMVSDDYTRDFYPLRNNTVSPR